MKVFEQNEYGIFNVQHSSILDTRTTNTRETHRTENSGGEEERRQKKTVLL